MLSDDSNDPRVQFRKGSIAKARSVVAIIGSRDAQVNVYAKTHRR